MVPKAFSEKVDTPHVMRIGLHAETEGKERRSKQIQFADFHVRYELVDTAVTVDFKQKII